MKKISFLAIILISIILPIILVASGYLKTINPIIIIFGSFSYFFLLIIVWVKSLSSALTIQPSIITPVSKKELEERLFSLNNKSFPFKVSKENGNIVIQWNLVDEKWIEIFASRKIKEAHKIILKLETNRVLARDVHGKFEYNINLGKLKINVNWGFSKGIQLVQYSRGFQAGIIFKNKKLQIGKAYDYKFDLAEMKNPIIQIITGSGWQYKPVVSFIPFLH
jgi:hypothetical protein